MKQNYLLSVKFCHLLTIIVFSNELTVILHVQPHHTVKVAL